MLRSARVTVLVDDYAGHAVRGLLAQHGLSLYVEAEDLQGRLYRVLLDAGQSGSVVLSNAASLGLGVADLDIAVVSHGHYDHAGGLLELLDKVGQRRGSRGGVTVVAHPLAFRRCIYISEGRVDLNVCVHYDGEDVKRRGATLLEVRELVPLAPGIYFLGEIPRYREDLASYVKGMYIVREGVLVEDGLRDDTGLALDVEGLGLVVLTGCGHSGIVNVVRYAKEKLGKEVHAIVGGLHLMAQPKERVLEVARLLKELGVRRVVAGHCTGFYAEALLQEEFGARFEKMHVGYSTLFTASSRLRE